MPKPHGLQQQPSFIWLVRSAIWTMLGGWLISDPGGSQQGHTPQAGGPQTWRPFTWQIGAGWELSWYDQSVSLSPPTEASQRGSSGFLIEGEPGPDRHLSEKPKQTLQVSLEFTSCVTLCHFHCILRSKQASQWGQPTFKGGICSHISIAGTAKDLCPPSIYHEVWRMKKVIQRCPWESDPKEQQREAKNRVGASHAGDGPLEGITATNRSTGRPGVVCGSAAWSFPCPHSLVSKVEKNDAVYCTRFI